jgi:hypothetical protein
MLSLEQIERLREVIQRIDDDRDRVRLQGGMDEGKDPYPSTCNYDYGSNALSQSANNF